MNIFDLGNCILWLCILPVKNILQDFLDIDIDNSENLTNDNLDKIINKDLSNSEDNNEDNIEDNNKNNCY